MKALYSCSLLILVFLASKANGQGSTCYSELNCDTQGTSGDGGSDPFNDCCFSSAFSSYSDSDGTCQNCDDVESIQFSSISYTVEEGAGFIALTIVRTGNISQERIIAVSLRDVPDSAEGGFDYGPFLTSELNLTVVFLSGERELAFGVQIREDNIVEPLESFTASLFIYSEDEILLLGFDSNPNPSDLTVGLNGIATVDIVDNDFVDILISLFNNASNINLGENDTEVTFLVSKEGEAVRDVRVMVLTLPLTATEGRDYRGLLQELTFAPEDTEMIVTVNVNDDAVVEDTEEFLVALALSEGESGVRLTASMNESIVTIEDDGDAVVLEFGTNEYFVNESDGMVDVDIVKTGTNERPVFVMITAQPDSTDESDFNLTQTLLTIEPSGSSFILTVPVVVFQEGQLEANREAIILSLSPAEGEEGAVIAGIDSATVIVLDSDEITVGFTQSGNLTVNEASKILNISLALQEGTLNVDVTVSVVAVTDGLAENGDDFQFGELSFTFSPSGSTEQTFQLDIVDDSFFEGREGLTLELRTDHPRVNLAPSKIEVLIVDNEDLDIMFSESVFRANETDAFVEVQLLLNADLQRDIQLDLVSQDGRASAGDDYIPISQTLTFSPSETIITVRVNLLDDDASEGSEDFLLQLVLVDEQLGRPGVVSQASVLLLDNENIFISFSSSNYTVREDSRFVAVEIVKSGITQQDLFVNISLANGTARGGTDYGPFPENFLHFPIFLFAEEVSTFFGVVIRDDEIVEANKEFFSVSLSLDAPEIGEGSNVFLQEPYEAIITIVDNDKINVTISPDVVTVTEADTVLVFNVSRNDNVMLDRPVVIDVVDSEGQTEQQMVFVENGAQDFQFNVTLQDNEIAEGSRTLFVNLSAPLEEVGVAFEENLAVINILDDDVANVDFTLSYYEFREFSTNNQICLIKTRDTARPFTVAVQPMDTTPDPPNTFQAIAMEDYNAATLNVTFEPESSMECVSIEIKRDAIAEGREVFAVSLSLPPDATYLQPGRIAMAIIEISDVPDVIFGFERTELEVGEDSGVFQLCVSIFNPASDQPLRTNLDVEIQTLPGTADESDYTRISTLVAFDETTRRQCIAVEITEDSIFEVPRLQSFTLQIASFRFSNESLVVLAAPNSTAVLIADDDRDVTIGFDGEVLNLSFDESVGEFELCVKVFQPNMSEVVGSTQVEYVRVIVNTVPGTADPDTDFSSISSIPVFSLGTGMQSDCFQVSINEDTEFEGDVPETFSVLLTAEVVSTTSIRRVSVLPDVAVINIIDNDAPTIVVVGFSQTQLNVREDVGSVELCVQVFEGEVVVPFQVRVTGFSGTAVFGVDFTLGDVILSFSDNNNPRCFPVTIIRDNDQNEQQESFTVELSLFGNPENVELVRSVATISIDDIDDIDVGSRVNDTVVGDPLYTVPLNLVNGTQTLPILSRETIPHLCYEIHGEENQHFNLVSDTCTNVNAFYVAAQSPLLQGWNVISTIGVRAVNLAGDCINIEVGVENECTPIVTMDGQTSITGPRFSLAGVSVTKIRNYVRVSVPNCENIRLVMWVTCQNTSGFPMVRFDIARGLNLRPTSHGLVGQFWNVPISVERYEYRGLPDPSFDIDQLYGITVTPVEGPSRRFVAEYYPHPWDATRDDVCFYAGNVQGGKLREIEDDETFNDPVIEGFFTDYRVDGLFEHDFQYSQFESEMCSV